MRGLAPLPGAARERTVPRMDARDPELRRELNATLQTRKELGQEYEEELMASFLDRFDQRLENVVDKQMRRQMAEQQMVLARGGTGHRPETHPRAGKAWGRGCWRSPRWCSPCRSPR